VCCIRSCHLCRKGKAGEMVHVGSCEYVTKQSVSNSHCDSLCLVSAVSMLKIWLKRNLPRCFNKVLGRI
jgi:hypothetical protein